MAWHLARPPPTKLAASGRSNEIKDLGMFPLILTVLNRDYSIPIKDCEYRGEHPSKNQLRQALDVRLQQNPGRHLD